MGQARHLDVSVSHLCYIGCGGVSKLDCPMRRMQRASTGTATDTGSVRAPEAVLRDIRQPSVQQSIGMHETAGAHLLGLTAW